MIQTILVGFLSVMLAALGGVKRFERLLVASFFLIFLFLSLRYNFGNDYKAYHDFFLEINRVVSVEYIGSDAGFEPGWVLLCRVFEPFGFFVLVAVLAFFSSFIYWRFIKNCVPRQYYWFAVFLYVFVPENMLTQLSAMRQAVAIGLVVVAFDFIVKRNLLAYLSFIGFATVFHFSALFVLPAYLLGIDLRFKKVAMASVFLLFALLFMYADAIVGAFVGVLSGIDNSAAVDRYVTYEDKGSFGSGVGIAYYVIYLSSLMWAHDYQDVKGRVVIKLAVFGVCLVPLVVSLAMLSRVAFYLNIFSIAAIPLVASLIRNRVLVGIYVAMHLAFSARSFMAFFDNPVFSDAYGLYLTVFDSVGGVR